MPLPHLCSAVWIGALVAPADSLAQQGPGLRLLDAVPHPLAYVSVDATASTSDATAVDGARARLLAIFDDPALRALGFGSLDPLDATDATADAGGSLAAWRRLRELVSVSSGELELALVGLLPREDESDLPLMVARTRVPATARDALARALESGTIAEPLRELGGHRTFGLSGGLTGSRRRPGALIEVALVDDSLLLSNHGATLEALLVRDARRTSTDPGASAGVLSADPAFIALRERLDLAPGSLFAYVDWQRAWRRLAPKLAPLDREVVDALGVTAMRHVLVEVQPTRDGLVTTAIVDQPEGLRGLLAATEPVSVRRLAQDLPVPGLASLTLSVDPARLLPEAGRIVGLPNVAGGCRRMGLDFASQVAPRLGRSSSCQLVLIDDAGARRARAAFSVKAKSQASAQALFRDVHAALEALRCGVTANEVDGAATLTVASAPGAELSIGLVDDSLVVGMTGDLVAQIRAREKALGRRELARHRSQTIAMLQRLRRDERVIGLFDLDFGELGTASADQRGRHAGLLITDGDVIRIEMMTPR